MSVERTERDIRPAVGGGRSDLPVAVIALLAAAGAIALFLVLDTRRHAATLPAAERIDMTGAIRPAPPLTLPPPSPPAVAVTMPPAPARASAIHRVIVAPPYTPPVSQPPPTYQPRQTYQEAQTYVPPQPQSERPRAAGQGDPALVIDTTIPDVTPPAPNTDAGAAGGGAGAQAQRTRATRLRQTATIVPQGALLPAVLESALNTSQPGLARAVVSRDVRGFDGTRVLIPRGSRLIGEYRSDVTPGQRRALLTWTRLIRPDGATVSLGSPASDPLGRAGVAGKVNSHFFARFGSAILRSVLDIGVNVASARIGDSPVIVGLPGSVGGGVGQSVGSSNVAPPTITVRQGTAITVFVARDLDFTSVEARP